MCFTNARNNGLTTAIIILLLGGVAFCLATLLTCNFVETDDGVLALGVFYYSLDLSIPGLQIPPALEDVVGGINSLGTDGKCEPYPDNLINELVTVQGAQIAGILGTVLGAVLVIWVSFNQCCYPVPCASLIGNILFFATFICTGLTWVMYVNDVCVSVVPVDGGVVAAECNIGSSGVFCILAIALYLVAWLVQCLLPSPKEAQLARELANCQAENKDLKKQLGHVHEENVPLSGEED
mmetsp:Transcript_47088/g.114942  ORF Transcript_47088/g.114942 Transcript_47088/m.114942 type:complete len:238 (-) Transcript_47088:361-1074(-)|eukprot:CAMPEP_0113447222 /NCGR_PEP_ID=MMETSP0014_2-20120614/4124_1 /TAXON_ID=2857 /ORGANISM="Nitzschia sp." /LENGTH=237 /DNA_ID=CAMNT_0000338365 /DNA_START=164 /DNA_END=877 /DNA_ORIENTATION=- /assembly_acc=CAM_ASM_000159